MTPETVKSILSIALLAAFADGTNDDKEREQIRDLAESLGQADGLAELPRLYQDILLRRVKLSEVVGCLKDPSDRQLAYEMAVCVCDADGVQTQAEQAFLAELKSLLQLSGTQARDADTVERQAEALASQTWGSPEKTSPTSPPPLSSNTVNEEELDKSILNYAILNGALELLPQSWASMAIIPLQIKMVYAIGKKYGVELDQGHIKEFLATLGVGLTSQYLEQFGRKLVGGLLGKLGGGLGKTVGRAATGMAFSFATTYALGHVSKRYYAGGRQMSTALLKDTFQSLLEPAKKLQQQYLPEMEQRSRTLDASQIMDLVRNR